MNEATEVYDIWKDEPKRIDIRDLFDNPRSQCCNAKVTIVGTVTHYYVCKECKKACDVI